MGFIKEQFIDVIEYIDESNKILVHKYERPGNEIKQGAQVIVRESQTAVFFKGGHLADILSVGTHTLETGNLPVLSSLSAFAYGFNSPIKADLYFISTRQFMDNKWATKSPIIMRDKEFGMVRVRAYGKYAFRVVDVGTFMREVCGTQGKFLTYDIIHYLSSFFTDTFAVELAELNVPVLDLAVQYQYLSTELLEAVNEKAKPLGIEFINVIVESVSLPEEVERLIDEQSGIGMASRNLNTYMQYQTARAMRDAAQQEGGLAGIGAGMAAGNAMAGVISARAEGGSAKEIDVSAQLRELKALLDEGILTQEEFSAKKKQILNL